jgi:uncharacterized protein with HEPN domain
MKNDRESKDFLQDILENAKKIGVFTKGVKFNSFKRNDEKIYAVLRALEVIGEAAKINSKVNQKAIPPCSLGRYGGDEKQTYSQIFRG